MSENAAPNAAALARPALRGSVGGTTRSRMTIWRRYTRKKNGLIANCTEMGARLARSHDSGDHAGRRRDPSSQRRSESVCLSARTRSQAGPVDIPSPRSQPQTATAPTGSALRTPTAATVAAPGRHRPPERAGPRQQATRAGTGRQLEHAKLYRRDVVIATQPSGRTSETAAPTLARCRAMKAERFATSLSPALDEAEDRPEQGDRD